MYRYNNYHNIKHAQQTYQNNKTIDTNRWHNIWARKTKHICSLRKTFALISLGTRQVLLTKWKYEDWAHLKYIFICNKPKVIPKLKSILSSKRWKCIHCKCNNKALRYKLKYTYNIHNHKMKRTSLRILIKICQVSSTYLILLDCLSGI